MIFRPLLASISAFTAWPFSGFRTVITHCAPRRGEIDDLEMDADQFGHSSEFRNFLLVLNAEWGNDLAIASGIIIPATSIPYVKRTKREWEVSEADAMGFTSFSFGGFLSHRGTPSDHAFIDVFFFFSEFP